MFDKRALFIIFSIILLIGAVSAVSANDSNQTTEITEEVITDDVSDVVSESPQTELNDVQKKTFTDLSNDINGNNRTDVYLNHDYAFDSESDTSFNEGINIYRAVTVWGNGHTVDGSNKANIFKISDGNVVFHDIVFTNAKAASEGGAINGACTAVNCTFSRNSAGYGGATYGASCVDCRFYGNTAIYNGGASCGGSFTNCIFKGNSAHYYGGAIYSGGNTRRYSIVNCTFEENHANVGGAVNVLFPEYSPVNDCTFIRNSAVWEAGAVYSVTCVNCNFTGNFADYGGVMKYGSASNCIFTDNSAVFGGAAYQATCVYCNFTGNSADYGGAIYDGFRTENCRFTANYAQFGGAMYGKDNTADTCYFIDNYAKNGGAAYYVKAKNCNFAYNEAIEYGGAMYGGSVTACIFKGNKAGVSGADTYNTEISGSSSAISNDEDFVYFDAHASHDGDGSKDNPYKYLYADRISSRVTAYFAEGTYELNASCTIAGARLIGEGNVVINSKLINQYDFIIRENSYLELDNLNLKNVRILNQATLTAEDVYFEECKEFDSLNPLEIEYGSGFFDSSYGGVIVCDSPSDSKSTLVLNGCHFQRVFDAFNGGAIAAINSDISISNTVFFHYSSTYKGGAIYCLNSNLNLYNGRFTPFTSSDDEDYTVSQYKAYTSYYGGSIYCENSNAFIDRSNFDGSVSFSFGGCLASLNSNITVRETNLNNSASLADGGGAIYNSNGELYIFDSTFYNNSAEFGGAICNLNSILASFHSTYSNNHANFYGGAIYDIYGTVNFYRNWFYVSHALVGGTIYTRIPNEFVMHFNTMGDSFANQGSSIFYDGKRENVISNYYANDYHVFAEFRATLDGEDYYIISNPLYYQFSSSEVDHLYYPYPVYEVYDDLVRMVIYGTDDDKNLTSIATHEALNNISVNISFSDRFVNPSLTVYLLEDLDVNLYLRIVQGNLYTGSRDKLFDGYRLIDSYSVDLSNKILNNGKYSVISPCTIDFGDSFISIKYDNLYEAASFNPVSLVNNSGSASSSSQTEPLASYYNSNDYGYVSSVKDQKNGGNCWAFSGISTLETCLSKATGVKYDFSEENAKNLMAAYSVYGIKIETNYAGYESMILSYLTSWLGPIDESVESYDDYSSISLLENPMFHIQNVKFLPARLDRDDNYMYKLAIMDYGAVSVTFKWGKDYHAVSLVGWDDNYNGKDSLGNDAHGAWIFKNSWGPNWENDGFGYLSYDQKISEQISPNMHAYTFVFNDNNPYTKIYQYDFAGISEFYHYMDSIYFKNSFIAENESLLSAFSTYFDSETNFTVMVYKNNQFMFSQDGTAYAGYYTLPFNTLVQLDKGDEFSIVVHNHNNGNNCIPVCSAEEVTKKTFSQNVSFISEDGVTWFDLYDYAGSCNVACIKAFTQNVNLRSIRVDIDEFSSVNTKNFNIKATLSDVDVNALNYCLMKFVIDGKVYYAQIKNGKASLNVNLNEGQHTLSAQYKDNVFESNVVQFSFRVSCDGSGQSFNAIQDLINDAESGSLITLYKDYFYDEQFDDGEYGVNINKTIRINGNGHVINGLSKAAGFYVSANNVVLENIVFRNTFSSNGGAVYIAAGNVTLNNCSFINSTAVQNGGGLYSLFDVSLNNCKFINDSANMGGGAYLMISKESSIKNSYFDNNSARIHGSAVYASGIGTNLISSTNFTNNKAIYNGGAVFSIVPYNNFTNCLFENNSANSGGAVFSNAKLNDFTKCRFSNNLAETSGGAIISHNNINIHDSDFVNNTSIYAEFSAFGSYGGGAIYSFDNLNIYNSNFIRNNADSGGAIYISKYLKIYKSKFINNSASYGGAIYTNAWQMFRSNMGILLFVEADIYDSSFINNTAKYGGAAYDVDLVKNCTFLKNHAENTAGAISTSGSIIDSRFIDNSANYGGALYNPELVDNSLFVDNSARYSAGAIYLSKSKIYVGDIETSLIRNSVFFNNSASYGGAVIVFDENEINSGIALNISDCNFTKNHGNLSGGAIYVSAKCLIMDSDFADNLGGNGGVVYVDENGTCIVKRSNFTNNSGEFGGAICSYSSNEDSISGLDVSYSHFADNRAIKSGGAIYSDGKCLIIGSDFTKDSANWGSAIYSIGYLDLQNSYVKSENLTPVMFRYHYENSVYGDLYLKNNRIDAKYGGIIYDEDEIPYKLPLNMVFNSVMVKKGQYVSICRLEDEDGNLFDNCADLELTLINQYNKVTKLSLKYDFDFAGYYLDTSSLDYGTYTISGSLSTKNLNCAVKQGVLYVVDESGRAVPILVSSGLTKVYGSKDELAITLKDNYGNVMPYTLINVNLNGRTTMLITNAQGKASLPINLAPNAYNVRISFNGNDNYLPTGITVNVVVKKISSKITASKKTFKLKAKTKKYTVTLKGNGKAIAKVKVTLKVKGKTYTAKTNAKGKATFKIKNLKKKGQFKATVKFAGNAYYTAASKKVKIFIKK